MELQIENYKDKHEYISENGIRSVVYLMDCMEGLKQIPERYFELAIVDPPYGINIAKNGTIGGEKCAKPKNYGVKNWDNKPPKADYFTHLIRLSRNQIIWGANHFISNIPINSSCWIVWDKDNTGNFADCELAWTSFDSPVRKFQYRWNGMLQQNMKNKEERIHHTQKPIALYEWLIKNYAKSNDKILDTHLGSGSSRIAAHKANLPFMGFELDKEYFDASVKRFENYVNQGILF